ncbi:MAG: HYR domain-containing protein, partial [Bacteroidota bacterium]
NEMYWSGSMSPIVSLDNFKFFTTSTTATSVSINDVAIAEGDVGTTNFVFTITRTTNSTAFDIDISLAGISATSGVDFTAQAPSTLSFAANGNLSQSYTVEVLNDFLVEGNETFQVSLSNPTNGTQISKANGIGTILDNDALCETFETEGQAGENNFTEGSDHLFTVSGELVIGFEAGTGSNGSDYYLESDITNVPHSGQVGSVTISNCTVVPLSLDLFTSNDQIPNTQEQGTVRFIGTLAAGGTAFADFTTGTDGGLFTENLSFTGTALQDQELTAMTVELLGIVDYVAIDDFKYDFRALTPTVGTITDATCNNSDGMAEISGLPASISFDVSYMGPGGAVGPLTLSSNSSGVLTINNLAPGSYTQLVLSSDGGSCSSSPLSFTIGSSDTENPTASNPAPINVTCREDIPDPSVSVVTDEMDNCPGTITVAFDTEEGNGGAGTTASPLIISRDYTVTDAAGNSITVTQTITVIDDEAPTANCPSDVTVGNDAGLCGANVSFTIPDPTDNCMGATSSPDPDSGSFFDVGTTPVTVTATDASGNTGTCTFNVTVNDTEAPIATCAGSIAPVTADENCMEIIADILSSPLASGSDNCPGVSLSQSPPPGAQVGIGLTVITITATDAAGLQGTCTYDLTVLDGFSPNAECVDNLEVFLDDNGDASISFADIDNGSSDNCEISSLVLDDSTFTCADAGMTQLVVLTATDAAGNQDTCQTPVTVRDTILPALVCQNVTYNLDANGEFTLFLGLVVQDIIVSSTDNCELIDGQAGIGVSQFQFDCSNLGSH